jgi:lipid II:glycine glycyltransferase (peptidoglycan interpeptide bridge formation enzyme)
LIIRELNTGSKEEWNHYLSLIKEKDVFFTPEYYEVFEKNGDGEACCFVFCEDGKIAIYPYMKVNLYNKGYELKNDYYDIEGVYGYNGVIYNSDDTSFRKNFYTHFTNFCKDTNIISEFTRFHTLIKNHNFSQDFLNIMYNRKTVYLYLRKDYDDIWNNSYSSENRNMIRKAQKNNINIIPLEDTGLFFKLYQDTMLSVKAEEYYYFNLEFFSNLKELLSSQLIILGAFYEDKLIASTLTLYDGAYSHYYLSAKDSKFSKYAPGNLMLNENVNILKEKNVELFNFGGGHTTYEDDSLLKFKKNFSKDINDFFIGSRIINDEVYKEVIKQWVMKYPELENKYKNIVQKYKLIK